MYSPQSPRKSFVILVLASCACYGMWFAYRAHYALKEEVASLYELEKKRAFAHVRQQTASPPRHDRVSWLSVQRRAKDAVVQVFGHISRFNWLEPYKTPDQGASAGSGFFIDGDGHFLTNYHVVEEASGVQIQIPSFGKKRFDVDVVGVSPERDIALLKVRSNGISEIKRRLGKITYFEFGSSDTITRTQEILALGYPLGQQTLKSTQGIVSGRELVGGQSYIQITAPLNQGISGGPSLDTNGRVIGINTAGFLIAQNVGYILPISEIELAIKDLFKVKLLRKPLLGGIFTVSNPAVISYLNNPPGGGWYVAQVFKEGLLDKMGVQPGDMLYEINGFRIDSFGEIEVPWSEDKVSVLALLNRFTIDENVHLVMYRNGSRNDVRFKFALQDKMPVRKIFPEFEKLDYEIFGGMVVMELTLNHVAMLVERAPFLMSYTRPENHSKRKLIITNVFPNSQAGDMRTLFPGTVINKVNGAAVSSLTDFRKAVLESKGKQYFTMHVTDRFVEDMFVAFSTQKIVEQEDALAMRYFYKKSNLFEKLQA